MPRTRRSKVACLLPEQFCALDVLLFLSVLDHAGRTWNHRAFDFELYAAPGTAASGRPLGLEASDLEGATAADVVFVPSSNVHPKADEKSAHLCQRLAELGATAETVCAVGNGQLLLAQAGMLAGQSACVPPELVAPLLEQSPQLQVDVQSPRLLGEHLLLGAFSLSAFELGLEIIRRVIGAGEARRVAQALGRSELLGQLQAGIDFQIK